MKSNLKHIVVLLLLCAISQNICSQEEQELPSVQISGSKFQLAYDHPEMTIIDFDFHEEGLLLLVRDNSSYHLRLTDERSKHLFDLTIPKKPRELFTDCFGNQHIVYDDSVYQILNSGKVFALFSPISIAKFNEHLAPYSFLSEGDLYWQAFAEHNKSVAYLKQSKESNITEVIHQTGDDVLASSTSEFYDTLLIDAANVQGRMSELSQKQLGEVRNVKEGFWLYEQILSLEIYCPIFLIEDSIYIFDHCRNESFVFNSSGAQERSFTIDYHKEEGWAKNILTDYETKIAYGQFLQKGKVYLKEINRTNGKIENTYLILAHNFPQKIKVRGGWVYYIYNEKQTHSLPNVYRQRMR